MNNNAIANVNYMNAQKQMEATNMNNNAISNVTYFNTQNEAEVTNMNALNIYANMAELTLNNLHAAVAKVYDLVFVDQEGVERKLNPAERVEVLAKLLLKFPVELQTVDRANLSTVAKEFENLLMVAVLELKNMPAHANKTDLTKANLHQTRNAMYYGGLEFFQALYYAEKNYGAINPKTGHRYPFMQLFNYVMEFKKYDLLDARVSEMDPVTYNMRQETVRKLLLDEAAKKNVKLELKGYLSKLKVLNLLKALKATPTFRNKVLQAMEATYSVRGKQQDGDDEGAVDPAEKETFRRYFSRKSTVSYIVRKLQRDMREVMLHAPKDVKKDFQAYMTFQLIDRVGELDFEDKALLDSYMHEELVKFIKKGSIPHLITHREREAEIYSWFLGIKYDTARKRLRKVETFLKELGEKCAKEREEKKAKEAKATKLEVAAK